MFHIIFTLDYEIHGNGDGNPYKLMIEPTYRILNLFDRYGAKLTIMADVAEIIKFKEYKDKNKNDLYHYTSIIEQLHKALTSGHDVQMHIHSGYMNAKIDNYKLYVDWDEYNLALLKPERIDEIIKSCKNFLMSICLEVKKDYKCTVFRSANWSMQPTRNIYSGLVNNGFIIDTSVYKHGKQYTNHVKYNYTDAYDALLPWKADPEDICKRNDEGILWEIPIYCEYRHIIHFITFIRIYRFIRDKFHKHNKANIVGNLEFNNGSINYPSKQSKNVISKYLSLFDKHLAWKLDFNQATGYQLINALKRIEMKYGNMNLDIPVILIGHSKSYIRHNEKTLEPFLRFIVDNPDKYRFSLFSDLKL